MLFQMKKSACPKHLRITQYEEILTYLMVILFGGFLLAGIEFMYCVF